MKRLMECNNIKIGVIFEKLNENKGFVKRKKFYSN